MVHLLALIFYEYVITFEREVSVVWRRRLSPSTLLLLTIRWTLLFEAICLVLPQPSLEVRRFAYSIPSLSKSEVIAIEVRHISTSPMFTQTYTTPCSCTRRTNLILIPALLGYGQTASTRRSLCSTNKLLKCQIIVFSGLRVFAITSRNYTAAVIVLILVLAPVMANSVSAARLNKAEPIDTAD